DRVAREIDVMNARNAIMAGDLLAFTSFAPSSAAQADGVDSLSHLFLACLEAKLQDRGLDRDSLDARRRAARELLIDWRSRAPSPNAPEAPSLADQLDPSDYERAISGYSPSGGSSANIGLRSQPAGVENPTGRTMNMSEREETTPPSYGSRGGREGFG